MEKKFERDNIEHTILSGTTDTEKLLELYPQYSAEELEKIVEHIAEFCWLGKEERGVLKMKKPRLLTLKEAAKTIEGLTVYRVRKLCIDGVIKYHRFGNKYMISESELLRHFNETA